MPRHWSLEPVFAVLLVCTGNICRSALAERLGRAYLDEALGDDAGTVQRSSAGVQAVVGSAMHPYSALVLRGRGGDPAGFVARQLVDDMAIDADLTLTMTRQHRRDVLRGAPRALARTFTLQEAAGLLKLVGDVDVPGDGLAERARSLSQGARRGGLEPAEQRGRRHPRPDRSAGRGAQRRGGRRGHRAHPGPLPDRRATSRRVGGVPGTPDARAGRLTVTPVRARAGPTGRW